MIWWWRWFIDEDGIFDILDVVDDGLNPNPTFATLIFDDYYAERLSLALFNEEGLEVNHEYKVIIIQPTIEINELCY